MATSILEHLRDHARVRGQRVAHGQWVDGGWRLTSWQTYYEQVRRFARALIHLGIEPGRRIGILGGNRPEWSTACLGSMSAQAVSVGIYHSNSPEQIRYILAHAEVPLVLVENQQQLAKIEQVRDRLPHLRQVVTMEDGVSSDPEVLDWSDMLALADQVSEDSLDERLAAIETADIATFIYTSGTTGNPKAVMLSHGNLLETGRIGNELHGFDENDSVISYLPLAHVAEQMVSVHMPAYVAYTVYYVEAPEKLLDYLTEIRPTIFFAVPRVWEKFHGRIQEKLDEQDGVARALATWAIGVGKRYSDALNRGVKPRWRLACQWRLADRLLLQKIRGRLGLSRLRVATSGAAPVSDEILAFFSGLGVRIYEVYGLSETCGPATWNSNGATRFGTVGPPLPEVEVRIDADGEVLFRGPNVFQGYFKDTEATGAALDGEGWFRTGDLGRLDEEGFLTLTGRKKEIIITSGGKNIAPAGLEGHLKGIPVVADAMVVGDDRRFLAALLTLDDETLPTVAGRNPRLGGHEDPAVVSAVRAGIMEINRQVARVETVRNFRVLEDAFSVEAGELTPTLKIKRQVVVERRNEEIEDMYREGQVLKPEPRH